MDNILQILRQLYVFKRKIVSLLQWWMLLLFWLLLLLICRCGWWRTNGGSGFGRSDAVQACIRVSFIMSYQYLRHIGHRTVQVPTKDTTQDDVFTSFHGSICRNKYEDSNIGIIYYRLYVLQRHITMTIKIMKRGVKLVMITMMVVGIVIAYLTTTTTVHAVIVPVATGLVPITSTTTTVHKSPSIGLLLHDNGSPRRRHPSYHSFRFQHLHLRSETRTRTKSITELYSSRKSFDIEKTKNDNDVAVTNTEWSARFDRANIVYGILWLTIVTVAFTDNAIIPHGTVVDATDAQLFQSIIDNPTHPEALNELYYCVFNLFAIIPILLSCLLLPVHEVSQQYSKSSNGVKNDMDTKNNESFLPTTTTAMINGDLPPQLLSLPRPRLDILPWGSIWPCDVLLLSFQLYHPPPIHQNNRKKEIGTSLMCVPPPNKTRSTRHPRWNCRGIPKIYGTTRSYNGWVWPLSSICHSDVKP